MTDVCQGVVVRTAEAEDAVTDCWQRSEIDVSQCERTDEFDLIYDRDMYAPNAELLDYLNSTYSVAVYGVPGALDPHFRLIWPAVLSDTALSRVRIRCTAPATAQEEGLAFNFPWPGSNFLQHAALYLYRPRSQVAFTHEDHTWVEVTHCAYTHGVHDRTPMYFFHAPGSGLRLNVGRSLRLRQVHDGDDDPHFAVHRATDRGDFATAARMLNVNLSQYDSIQYPLYTTETWRGLQFTEIAMLHWHNEREHVTARLDELRCGPASALRECRTDEPAITQMAVACSGPLSSAMQRLRSRASCEDVDPWNGERVDVNGDDLR